MSHRVSQLVSHLSAGGSVDSAAPVRIASRANGVAVVVINNPPVNSLHPRVQQGLLTCYRDACADASIKAVVLTGEGKFFMAGADIEYIQSMQNKKSTSKKDIIDFAKAGHDIFNELESGPKPIVAAVNGTALGGGCELAMACSSRVGVASAVLGLPELNLGILPGLGGTQRLPRLIGLQAAIQNTMAAKNIPAAQALKLGLLDQIVAPKDLIAKASQLALDIASGKVKRRISLKLTDKIGTYEMGKAVIETARAGALKKNRNLPHPFAYLDCVETGLLKGGEAGIAKEIESLAVLVLHPVSKALIHFFFASRATTKIPNLPAKPTGKIQTVAVLGGGTMGAGICIVYLLKGYNVILKELNDKLVLAGVERIINDLTRVLKARRLPIMAIEQIMRNLTTTTSYDGFEMVDLVVEAVLENLKLKQEIFAELERRCNKNCILATNTSTIDIEQIGAKTNCADRIVGLHFFSPAHVMPLLEIVRSPKTSPNTVALSVEMAKRVGKTAVVSGNCVGFIANRGFFPYGQAAGLLVDAGVSPYDIDRALEAFGMPMGVFRMADLSGVDVFKHVSVTINAAYGARCYNSTLGEALFQAGRLGQKTGKGYYQYVKGKPVPDAALAKLIEQSRANAKGLPNLSGLKGEELVEATLFPVVNECLRIVAEGFALSESDVDVVTVFGYGYPAWRGGVLHWAANHEKGGFKYIRDRLKQFSSQWGANNSAIQAFFKPCDLLEKKAA